MAHGNSLRSIVTYFEDLLLKGQFGDRSFRRILRSLRCSGCGAGPAPVFLLTSEHREFCYGAEPGWAIELVKKPS